MNTPTDLHDLLQRRFGFPAFRTGQEEVIRAVLAGEDVLAILPTGGGKSLCFQLPALVLDGLTLVVSPLIALMKDQVDGLVAKGLPATFVNSTIDPDEAEDRLRRAARGEIRLLYVAPERFRSDRFRAFLPSLKVALFAVDEAHCISQWGHDFRPDYTRLKAAAEALGRPRVLGLTATATPEVRDDIQAQLGLGRGERRAPRVFVSGFARPNLTLAVETVGGREEKFDRIDRVAAELKTGIIYCATRKAVERVAEHLGKRRVPVVSYHAGMDDAVRTRAQNRFMKGEAAVAVATNAFGMGIDRADLRFVLHHDIPGSVEAYYQEAGRAGRDGKPARCELLFSTGDIHLQEFFIDGANPTRETVESVMDILRGLCGDGPIEMPVDDIAELVGKRANGMAVGTSLGLLERAGWIRRDYRPGSRTYTTHVPDPGRLLNDLAIDFARLAAKRKRDLAKFRRMLRYAEEDGCRHGYILDYFGETDAAERCGACDNCEARSGRTAAPAAARAPARRNGDDVRSVLACVGQLNGRFGRGRLAQTLAGSKAKEILKLGLDELPEYGRMRDYGEDGARALVDAMIDAGCLKVEGDEYPVVSLTRKGREILAGTEPFDPAPAADGEEEGRKGAVRKRSRRASAPVPLVPDGPADPALFEALRAWRRTKASDLGGIPAYRVYPDRTLRNLASIRPKTLEDLARVGGIGPARLDAFGSETLSIIAAWEKRGGEAGGSRIHPG